MNNKTIIACLIAFFGLFHTANVAGQQPIKLPPQGVVNSIEPANILISLDTSGSMGFNNNTWGNNAVRAIHSIVSQFGSVANFGLVRWSSEGPNFIHDINGPVIPITTNSKNSNDQILRAAELYMTRGISSQSIFRWNGGTDSDVGGMGFPRAYFQGSGRSLIGGNCSKTIVILISDGQWNTGDAGRAGVIANQLLGLGVITVVIGIDALHPVNSPRWNDYNAVSSRGGGGTPLFSADSVGMQQALTEKLSTILAESFSATSPAVMSSQQFGDLIFQPSFEYRKEGQWKGALKAYGLDTKNMDATQKWDFGEILQRSEPGDRFLWTVAPGLPSAISTGYRNFSNNYVNQLMSPMAVLNTAVTKQIVNFVQGYDIYDDDRNNLRGEVRGDPRYRRHMLGDIFHSKPVFVGPPQSIDATDTNMNGVWGYFENLRPGAHQEFVNAQRGRRPLVLAASNSGVLHAVDATVGLASSGQEVWGFVPPPLLDKLQWMAPTSTSGTSQTRYMIDGAITVRDVFINNNWRTYAAFGYGLGARALTVIDITNVQSPLHVVSIENEWTGLAWRIKVWDQNGVMTDRTNDPTFADYKQMGYSTSAPIFTFHKNSGGVYAPVLVLGAGSISRPPAMMLESGPGGTRRPSTGNTVYMVSLDGTIGRLLKTVPLHNPANLYSGCSESSCPVPYNQQVADIEIIEGGASANMKEAFGFELFIPNYSGSLQSLNLSATSNALLNSNVSPTAIFDPGNTVTNVNDRVITVPISISGLTYEKKDGRLNITFGTGDMVNLSMQGKTPLNKVYSLQGNESDIVNGREFFPENVLENISGGKSVCPMPTGKKGWQMDINTLVSRNKLNQTVTFSNGKVASKITQYGGSTVVPLYKPRIDGQCSIGDSGIYLFDSICGTTRQSQAINNAMIGGVSIIGDTLIIGISGGKGRENLSAPGNNFQKIDNLIIGKGVFDSKNTGSGKGTATIYNKQQVR